MSGNPRPGLGQALNELVVQQQTAAGSATPTITNPERAATLDALVSRADADPAWFASLPATDRQVISDWRTWRRYGGGKPTSTNPAGGAA